MEENLEKKKHDLRCINSVLIKNSVMYACINNYLFYNDFIRISSYK